MSFHLAQLDLCYKHGVQPDSLMKLVRVSILYIDSESRGVGTLVEACCSHLLPLGPVGGGTLTAETPQGQGKEFSLRPDTEDVME